MTTGITGSDHLCRIWRTGVRAMIRKISLEGYCGIRALRTLCYMIGMDYYY
jgi:hypothetical protein